MSDLYLVLRSRLDEVQSWTKLGTDVMKTAQSRTGLSDERLAREIPTSTRTWIRWKQRGEVPTQSLQRVANVLGLEVERAHPVRVTVNDDVPLSDAERFAQLEQLTAETKRIVDRILALLEDDAPNE